MQSDERIKYCYELLQMEYEKCVVTYMDIYQAIWKIFSYYSAITAAFLISSSEFFPALKLPAVVFIASLPLAFWWVGIYSPMNRYGEGKINRLIDIEKEIKTLLEIDDKKSRIACHYKEFQEQKPSESFFHMLAFKSDIKIWPPQTWFNILNPQKYMRVKFAADALGILLSITIIFLFVKIVICFIANDWTYFYDPQLAHGSEFP